MEGEAVPSAVGPSRPSTGRGTRLIGWSVWLASLSLVALGLALLYLTRDVALPDTWGFRGFPAMFALAFATVGGVIAVRRPGNVIGLLFAVGGLVSGVQFLGIEYATYGLVAVPGSLPGAIWPAWFASWIWVWLVVICGPLLMLLFPDGSFLTSGWRAVAWLAIGSAAVASIGFALTPGPLEAFGAADNPLGVAGTGLFRSAVVGQLLGLILAAASLVVRYRRASHEAQQQLKWVALAGALVAVVGPLGLLPSKAGQAMFIVGLCALPASAGVAVLRYGLYEIDTIINRALVYGLLTAILAGISAALVALLERLFQALVGGGSETAIVATTLVVVSLFTPIKNRLQGIVDRHFKEADDPTAVLGAFVETLLAGAWVLDPDRALARLAALAAAACAAPGAMVEMRRPGGGTAFVATVGQWSGEAGLTVSTSSGPFQTSLSLAPRRTGVAYRSGDREAIQTALASIAAEVRRSSDSRLENPPSAQAISAGDG